VNKPVRKVDGLLFDKDGTLFDFHATWSDWALRLITTLSHRHGVTAPALADAMGFDLSAGQFHPDSPIIAGTNREAAECVARALPGVDIDPLERFLAQEAATAPLATAVPLGPLLEGLRAEGLRLGVMTNDAEISAIAQLESAQVIAHFHFVAGFDSGFGAKPAPDPLLAFAAHVDLAPGRIAMIGDSTHDLIAGRAAGMQTIGVLTGPASAAELAPFADTVLPHIGHLPDWLAG
jgi:phosphoglycolate phosphatase